MRNTSLSNCFERVHLVTLAVASVCRGVCNGVAASSAGGGQRIISN